MSKRDSLPRSEGASGKPPERERRLAVDRAPRKQLATLEHIVPRHHGGTNELMNLAVACARCNHGKGVRLDHRKPADPTLRRVIDMLQERRKKRYREVPEGLLLPAFPETT